MNFSFVTNPITTTESTLLNVSHNQQCLVIIDTCYLSSEHYIAVCICLHVGVVPFHPDIIIYDPFHTSVNNNVRPLV